MDIDEVETNRYSAKIVKFSGKYYTINMKTYKCIYYLKCMLISLIVCFHYVLWVLISNRLLIKCLVICVGHVAFYKPKFVGS